MTRTRNAGVFGVAAAALLLLLQACGSQPGESADTTGGGRAGSSAAGPSAAAKHLAQLAPMEQPAPAARAQAELRHLEPAAAPRPTVSFGGERYPYAPGRDFVEVVEQPLSTFSIDVDTASYVHVRRILRAGRLPPPQAVRVEELVNYFRYGYPEPAAEEAPFSVSAAVLPTPWSPASRLLQIGLKGRGLAGRARPRGNLVFLIDVSGSMRGQDRLELARQALSALTLRLRDDDRVAIVTFAGGAERVLGPTPVAERSRIEAAIAGLAAGGSTGGERGLELAYAVAGESFEPEAINRVLLISDGDFNVGLSDPDSLRRLIERKRKSGVYLTVLTVGSGNVNDHIAQALAQYGNGQAAHLDSLVEARKVLDDELAANLVPIADDVKIQIELNPSLVAAYRLIGYETRALADRDFADDRIDAGEIGSGHSVTALYEILPTGADLARAEPLRYQTAAAAPPPAGSGPDAGNEREYAFVKLRYKRPGEATSRRLERPVTLDDAVPDLEQASADQRFAVAVAAFGQLLRGELDPADFNYGQVFSLARGGRGDDPLGLRGEFLQLVRQAESLAQAER